MNFIFWFAYGTHFTNSFLSIYICCVSFTGDLASDALIDYISRFSPITDGLEGRISFLKETTCTAHASIVTPSVAMWMCYLITYFITMTRV